MALPKLDIIEPRLAYLHTIYLACAMTNEKLLETLGNRPEINDDQFADALCAIHDLGNYAARAMMLILRVRALGNVKTYDAVCDAIAAATKDEG